MYEKKLIEKIMEKKNFSKEEVSTPYLFFGYMFHFHSTNLFLFYFLINPFSILDLLIVVLELEVKILLKLFDEFFVLRGRDEADSGSLGSLSTSSTNSMEVGLLGDWEIEVNDHVNLGEVHSSSEEIIGDKDSSLLFLELSVDILSLTHLQSGVSEEVIKIGFLKVLREIGDSLRVGGEDDSLVIVGSLQDVLESVDLLVFFDIVSELVQSVQYQLGLVLDDDGDGVLQIFLANFTDFVRNGS